MAVPTAQPLGAESTVATFDHRTGLLDLCGKPERGAPRIRLLATGEGNTGVDYTVASTVPRRFLLL